MHLLLKIQDREKFPTCIKDFKILKGICVGGCISKYKDLNEELKTGKEAAHAHTNHRSKHFGWICLSSPAQLFVKPLLLHEVAHLLTHKERAIHGKLWREKVVEIGGTTEPFWGYGSVIFAGFHKNGKQFYKINKDSEEGRYIF